MSEKYEIGQELENGYVVVDRHEASGGWILRRDLTAVKPECKVFAAEQFILEGAFGSPIWEVYTRVSYLVEDIVNGGSIYDVLLVKTSCGAVEAWMTYDTDDLDVVENLYGHGASPNMASQEARLKFLTKFGMDDGCFNKLNPPWRDL